MIKFCLLKIILVHCDNVKNNSNNNCESDMNVLEKVCSHINQKLNEDYDTKQNSELNQYVQISTRIKKPPKYLKD